MFWYARGLEIAACPRQSSRIQGPGHRRRPWRLRCRHREDRPMGAGKPGAQGARNDRQIPPLGVTPMPSYGWPGYKGGVAQVGGARFWQLQICTIRGQSPRRCGIGGARESALDVGWHGLPESSGVKPRAAPGRRVPASPPASARRTGGGGSGGSDPLFFGAGAPPGRGKWSTLRSTSYPSPAGVAPSTVIPGGKAVMAVTTPGSED